MSVITSCTESCGCKESFIKSSPLDREGTLNLVIRAIAIHTMLHQAVFECELAELTFRYCPKRFQNGFSLHATSIPLSGPKQALESSILDAVSKKASIEDEVLAQNELQFHDSDRYEKIMALMKKIEDFAARFLNK
jgi:hypothetical protein